MSYEVVLPYDPVWRPLEWAKEHCPSYITIEWAKEHCPSYITNQATAMETGNAITVSRYYDTYNVVYYFSEGNDATAFALKWK